MSSSVCVVGGKPTFSVGVDLPPVFISSRIISILSLPRTGTAKGDSARALKSLPVQSPDPAPDIVRGLQPSKGNVNLSDVPLTNGANMQFRVNEQRSLQTENAEAIPQRSRARQRTPDLSTQGCA